MVAASRQFICVRPLTYENADEMAFLKTVYARRDSLENTSFGILAPDGKTHLTRSARSPKRVFADGAAMAAAMDDLAKEYPGNNDVGAVDLGLPVMESPRFALNTAACDTRLLVVAHAAGSDAMDELVRTLAPIAWSEGIVGQFLYATTTDAQELAPIEDVSDQPGIVLVKPGPFGLAGKVLRHLEPGASASEIRDAMLAAHAENRGYSKDSRRHIADAQKAQANWQSATGERESKNSRDGRRRGRGARGGEQRRRRGGQEPRETGASEKPTGGEKPPTEKKKAKGERSR